jgi:hypothetical protein
MDRGHYRRTNEAWSQSKTEPLPPFVTTVTFE